ncbi:hypothetical protein TIFTF001_044445 [Ficus carica]|uniref:Uncharacterized protein n=1 Tax=Ficus carica TaxID=3494 RepID=A0AA88D8P1_FICCA|nr:hypothetical protein TIFTF001_044445 [Ficus carica]
MFTNDNVHDKSKIKFKSGLVHDLSWIGLAAPTIPWLRATVSSILAILDTRRWGMEGLTVKLRDGDRYAFCVKYIFETMDDDRDAALVFYGMQPLLFDGTQRTASLAGWREPAMPGGTSVDFHALITVRYGLPPDEDANMPYRDPEIYNDMYLERFLSYVADWGSYPNESMGHYCRRFQEAMLPHILPALGSPLLQALFLLREGLPPNVRPFVSEPMVGMTLEGMIEAIMEAEIIVQGIQAAAPEEDLVVLVYDTGIAEAGAENDVMDHADIPVDPEDHPEDPPVIIIESDDKEEDFDDLEELEEDPEEILFNHADWDADSDDSSDITIT